MKKGGPGSLSPLPGSAPDVKLIESQIEVIKLRIAGSTGPEVQDLKNVKEHLDIKN